MRERPQSAARHGPWGKRRDRPTSTLPKESPPMIYLITTRRSSLAVAIRARRPWRRVRMLLALAAIPACRIAAQDTTRSTPATLDSLAHRLHQDEAETYT